jgi:hypothetical protein
VTLYLLDENVLRELKRGGHKNVHQWIKTVDDTDLRLSVATLFEKRRGAEALMKREPDRARRILDGIEMLEKSFSDRIIPIDGPVVAEWTPSRKQKQRPMGRCTRRDRTRPRSCGCDAEHLRFHGAWCSNPQSVQVAPGNSKYLGDRSDAYRIIRGLSSRFGLHLRFQRKTQGRNDLEYCHQLRIAIFAERPVKAFSS